MKTDETASGADPAKGAPTWSAAIRGNVLMMGLVSFFTDFASEMMNPLLPIFIAGLVGGARAALWVGLTEGIAETTASLLKIFSGRISDKLGKRKALVVAGYTLSSLARPAMALVGAVWQVTALKFGDRVGKGIRTSPRDALVSDSVGPERRGLAFGFHRAMDHLGAILGPLVALAILYAFLGYGEWAARTAGGNEVGTVEMNSLRWLFGLALIPGLAALSTLIFKVREIAPAEAANGADKASVWKQIPRRFYAFVGIVTLFALGNSSDMFLLLYGWTSFGLTLAQVIALWIVLHVSKVAFSVPGGMLSDKVGRRPVIVSGWVVYALVYLGMAVVGGGHAGWFWTLFIIYGIYHGMTEGVEKALVADFVSSEHRGTAFGIYHGAVGIAALPASMLFGVVWYALNRVQPGLGPRVAFGVGAGLAGLATVLLIVLLSTSPRAQAGTSDVRTSNDV